LNGDVIGDEVFLDELTNEVKVRLTCRREADFDFLEPHLHQRIEHAHLALWVHWVYERLIAITQVDAAPQGSLLDHRVWPGTVGEHDRNERLVSVECHFFRCHILWRHRMNP